MERCSHRKKRFYGCAAPTAFSDAPTGENRALDARCSARRVRTNPDFYVSVRFDRANHRIRIAGQSPARENEQARAAPCRRGVHAAYALPRRFCGDGAGRPGRRPAPVKKRRGRTPAFFREADRRYISSCTAYIGRRKQRTAPAYGLRYGWRRLHFRKAGAPCRPYGWKERRNTEKEQGCRRGPVPFHNAQTAAHNAGEARGIAVRASFSLPPAPCGQTAQTQFFYGACRLWIRNRPFCAWARVFERVIPW